ncbi:MAG: hypothetical protein R2707_20680 [Acidimicrobiales bacterium]
MAYDPQATRRRPKPEADDTAPVDALLGAPTPPTTAEVVDDPPPTPAVTPAPADPISDKLVISSGLATAIGGLAALLALRHLWRRRRKGDDE